MFLSTSYDMFSQMPESCSFLLFFFFLPTIDVLKPENQVFVQLGHWFSKYHLGISSIGITWGLVLNANPQAPVHDLLDQKLGFFASRSLTGDSPAPVLSHW